MRISLITLAIAFFTLGSAAAQAPLAPDTPGTPDAPDAQPEDDGPATQYWLDASTSGLFEHQFAGITRAGIEVNVDAHAEQDGGFFHNTIVPWGRVGAQLRLAAGGQAPGLGGGFSLATRIIDPHWEEDGIYMRLLPVDLEFSHESRVRPPLSSRRELWARPFTRTTYGWSVTFGNITPLKGLEILNMGLKTTHLAQPDEAAPLKQARFEIGAHFFAYRRDRGELQPQFEAILLRIEAMGIANAVGSNASVGSVDILRLSGIPLGRHLNLDLAGGFAGTGSMHISTSANGQVIQETTVITEDLPNISTRTGRARLHGSHGDVAAALTLDRSMYLTVDVHLAIEDRLALAGTWNNPWGQLSVQGFAAQSRLWTDETTSQSAIIGGAAATWQHKLADDLSVTGTLEVAQSFYGSLAGDTSPESALATRAIVTLTKHLGTPWPERW